MNYGEIINQNLQRYPWSKYAYHFTDVTNAVNILAEGKLYSRKLAIDKKLMMSDNASEKIISYSDDVTKYVRFYFRPMTPTQYYNEGYKHPDFRFENNKNANVTVPIFFLFDLESMLNSGRIMFSEKTLAGINPAPPKRGSQNFAALPFDKIYSTNYYDTDNKAFKHAELVCLNEFALEPYLRKIVCRNSIKVLTLVLLLYEKNSVLFDKYKSIIFKENADKLKLFERNGLFVEKIFLDGGNLHINFSKTDWHYNKRFNRNSSEVEVSVLVGEKNFSTKVNYCSPSDYVVQVGKISTSTVVKIFFDDHLAAFDPINVAPNND